MFWNLICSRLIMTFTSSFPLARIIFLPSNLISASCTKKIVNNPLSQHICDVASLSTHHCVTFSLCFSWVCIVCRDVVSLQISHTCSHSDRIRRNWNTCPRPCVLIFPFRRCFSEKLLFKKPVADLLLSHDGSFFCFSLSLPSRCFRLTAFTLATCFNGYYEILERIRSLSCITIPVADKFLGQLFKCCCVTTISHEIY